LHRTVRGHRFRGKGQACSEFSILLLQRSDASTESLSFELVPNVCSSVLASFRFKLASKSNRVFPTLKGILPSQSLVGQHVTTQPPFDISSGGIHASSLLFFPQQKVLLLLGCQCDGRFQLAAELLSCLSILACGFSIGAQPCSN